MRSFSGVKIAKTVFLGELHNHHKQNVQKSQGIVSLPIFRKSCARADVHNINGVPKMSYHWHQNMGVSFKTISKDHCLVWPVASKVS